MPRHFLIANEAKKTLMTDSKTEDQDVVRHDGRASDILDPNNQIGIKLRSLYGVVQEEIIPDRFLDLLEKLDQAERMSAKSGE